MKLSLKMKTPACFHSLSAIAAAGLLLGALSPTIARADVAAAPGVSSVHAYFGSQNDGFQNSSPGALLPVPPGWSPIGTPGVPFPGSPTFIMPTPGGPPSPTLVPGGPNTFDGIAYNSLFFDVPGNTASSSILGTINPLFAGFFAGVEIDLTMSLTQVGALSYAYEELDFSIDYSITGTGVLNSSVTQAFIISGIVGSGPGSFAQFGGRMDYWELSGGVFLGKSLGSLSFSHLDLNTGPFSTTMSVTGPIGVPGNPGLGSGDGIRITGSFFVAGDPSTINVQSIPSVPEPASALLLLGSGAMLLLRRRRVAAL